MDLLQLQYFCTIAHYENITKAAQAMFVSQPNLSTSLSRLEDDLGVKLFERRRGKVTLTKNGKLFLEYVERTLNELNSGIDAVRAAQRSTFDQLRVVSSQMDFITEILHRYPVDKQIKIKQIHCSHMDVYDRVLADDADFGFYFGEAKTKVLEYIPMLTSERIAIVHKGHPFALRKRISVQELADQPLICNYCRDDADFFKTIESSYGFIPQILFECDDTQVETALISSGRGIAVAPLPNYYKYKRLNPDLPIHYVRFEENLPLTQMGIVRRQGVRLTESALFFLQQTEAFFKEDKAQAMDFIESQEAKDHWNVDLGTQI